MASSFTSVFGGETIYPANPSYRAFSLSANVTLAWPTESVQTGNIVAAINDVTPTGAGFTIRMPPANQASTGDTALFFNVGASSFIIADNSGNTIVSIAPGQAWQVYLTSNATVNGTWRSTQYGAGASSATAGSLTGAGIKAIGTTLNQAMSSTALNTNYAAGDADRSEVFNWTGGAGTITLPSSAVVGNDWFIHVRNSGTGGCTLATSVGGQNINGGASIILNPGDSCIIFCDGSNFFTIGLGRSAAFAFDFVAIDLTGQPSPYNLTGANLNRIAYRFTGTITANVQVIVPNTVQQYWVTNETSLASDPYSIEIKTLAGLGVTVARNQRAIMYCDGTNVIDADSAGISLPLSVSQGGTGAITASAARINLGATSVGNALFVAVSESAARSTLGASVTGDALFTSASAGAARTTLGSTAVGDALFTTASASAARTTLGSGATGDALFTAGTASAARTTLGSTATGDALFTAATAAAARTTLGATTVGSNILTVANPSAITFLRVNADNTTSLLSAADFRTAIGVGTGTGSVTQVNGVGTVAGLTLTGTVTTSGDLTLGGTFDLSSAGGITGTLSRARLANGVATSVIGRSANSTGAVADIAASNDGEVLRRASGVLGFGAVDLASTAAVTGTLPVARGGTGAATLTGVLKGNGTSAFTAGTVSLTTEVSGTLPIASGGTGQTSGTAALDALAGVTSTVFGRASLAYADASAGRTALGLGTVATLNTIPIANGGTGQTTATAGFDALAGVTSTSFGRTSLTYADASAARTALGLGTLATLSSPLGVANGGTGLTGTPTNGQVPIGNGTGFTLATLTAGTGITVTNGAGTITIASTASGGTVTSVDVSGGTTGLTFSGGPVTGSGTITAGGTLAVANGGTGATTVANARTNLGAAASGAVTGSGITMSTARLLGRTTASTGAIEEITVGSGLSLSAGTLSSTAGGGTVTSVDVSGGTTGLTFSGGPINSSGTITMAGTLALANGGTGQTAAPAALNAVAGVTSTAFGRTSLTYADASAARSAIGVTATGSDTTYAFRANNLSDLASASTARTNLGSTTVGDALFTTASAGAARTTLGATTVGGNLFTLTNPGAITFLTINADNTVSTRSAALFRSDIGLGSLATLNTINNSNWSGTALTVANGGTGATSFTSNILLRGNGTGALQPGIVTDNGTSLSIAGNVLLSGSTPVLTFNTGGPEIAVPTANTMTFSTAGSERARLDSAGNFGIGTTSPGYRLDIAAGDTTAGVGYAARLRANGTANAATIQFTDSGATAQRGAITVSSTEFIVQSDSTSTMRLRVNGTDRLNITSGGLVSVNFGSASGNTLRNTTISTSAPSGGSDGDVWLRY